MTRDELVAVGARALTRDGLDVWANMTALEMAGRVLDAVDPQVRSAVAHNRAAVTREAFADLRGRVQVLRDNAHEQEQARGGPSPWTAYVVAYDHVLDLIDGADP